MAVAVDNGKAFVWVDRQVNDADELLAQIRNIVAVRFPGEIHVKNHTKDCSVVVEIRDKKITITVTNPADKEFRLTV